MAGSRLIRQPSLSSQVVDDMRSRILAEASPLTLPSRLNANSAITTGCLAL